MNNATFYILHCKSNLQRRNYLRSVEERASLAFNWIDRLDPGEYSESAFYSFDQERFRRMLDVIRNTLVGYSLGNYPEMSNLPWSSSVALIRRLAAEGVCFEDLLPWTRPRELSAREISGTLKHRQVWEAIAAGGTELAIVAEDDIIFEESSLAYLQQIIRTVPADADYVTLVHGMRIQPRIGNTVVNECFYIMDPPRDSSACCALMTRSFAHRLLKLHIPILLPIDWEYTWAFSILGATVYSVMPGVFLNGSESGVYPSSIR